MSLKLTSVVRAGAVEAGAAGDVRGGGENLPADVAGGVGVLPSLSDSSTMATFRKPVLLGPTGDFPADEDAAPACPVLADAVADSSSSSLPLTSSMATFRKPLPLLEDEAVGAGAGSSSLSLSSSIATRVYPAAGAEGAATGSSSSSSSIRQLGSASTLLPGITFGSLDGPSLRSLRLATIKSPLIWVFPGDSARASWNDLTASS
mmetsp:Transcript_102377/g.181799  ORF Transcript_102377/g.181799 Transcript_102377/m.181799 type:complete len:205 (+) Transcript_102377:111-725(+)